MNFFTAFSATEGKADPMNHTTGKQSLQLNGVKRSCASLLRCDSTIQLYLFKDKLKCISNGGPWTSQINRITEKGCSFSMEYTCDFSLFSLAEILKAFIRETFAPE